MIKPGIMRIVKGGQDIDMAITGGFLEVRDDRVTVLADAVERAEDIDVTRAEEARKRAEHSLAERVSLEHYVEAQAALQRALLRIKAVERRRHRREGGRPQRPPGT
jgi:F-type H+-transporting ATPase subunit epsilon